MVKLILGQTKIGFPTASTPWCLSSSLGPSRMSVTYSTGPVWSRVSLPLAGHTPHLSDGEEKFGNVYIMPFTPPQATH